MGETFPEQPLFVTCEVCGIAGFPTQMAMIDGIGYVCLPDEPCFRESRLRLKLSLWWKKRDKHSLTALTVLVLAQAVSAVLVAAVIIGPTHHFGETQSVCITVTAAMWAMSWWLADKKSR